MIEFLKTDSLNESFQKLAALLDADLAIRDGDEHAFYAAYNNSISISNVMVCFVNKVPVACGAFRPFSEETTEIKRMFVLPEYRGNGYAKMILEQLESWAHESKFKYAILETGKKQPEAINLYEKAGYKKISNYGPYQNVTNSVCFKKQLY